VYGKAAVRVKRLDIFSDCKYKSTQIKQQSKTEQ